MGRAVVRVVDPTTTREWWLMWSDNVDAPVTYGMTEAEFRDWYLSSGEGTAAGLEERMERARKNGTSFQPTEAFEQTIVGNRAGPRETTLTLDEILQNYCRTPGVADG